jgi:hypothetical protein
MHVIIVAICHGDERMMAARIDEHGANALVRTLRHHHLLEVIRIDVPPDQISVGSADEKNIGADSDTHNAAALFARLPIQTIHTENRRL